MDPMRGNVVPNSRLFVPPFARPQSYMMAAAPASGSKSLKGIIAGKKKLLSFDVIIVYMHVLDFFFYL